jgi:CRAL/TRIO, N-terminal domain/CRAL/TRIO domain
MNCSRSFRRSARRCLGSGLISCPHTFRNPHTQSLRSFGSRFTQAAFLRKHRVSGLSIGGPTLFIIALCSCTSFALILSSSFEDRPAASSTLTIEWSEQRGFAELSSLIESSISKSEALATMSAEALAGRPGALTPDQEAKLLNLWQATLKVFGVYVQREEYDLNGTNGVEAGENGGASDTATPTPPDKQVMDAPSSEKKKRISFFRRRQQKDGETQTTLPSTDATANVPPTLLPPSVEENDKYGQTKGFQQALASQTPEDLRTAFWNMVKHDHPDGLLLRFLRARKWDVERALVMLVSTMHWRGQEMHVDDDVIKEGEGGALRLTQSPDLQVKKEAEDFLAQLRIGKSYLHGLDKHDRPICVVRVRLHRQGEQSEKSLERYTVYLIETARLLLNPPVDTAVSCMWTIFRGLFNHM